MREKSHVRAVNVDWDLLVDRPVVLGAMGCVKKEKKRRNIKNVSVPLARVPSQRSLASECLFTNCQ